MSKYTPLPSAETLHALLSYDAGTGVLLWRDRWNKNGRPLPPRNGGVAGCVNAHGYRQVSIHNTFYMAHRLAWKLVYGVDPDDQIDHRDLNKDNNAISNLRHATNSNNAQNSLGSGNKHGLKGVRRTSGRFYGRIYHQGHRVNLGAFDTAQEAHAAYAKAAADLFGEFARAV